MAEIGDLNIADASNTGRFPELQAPGTLNDGGRALEGLLARGLKSIIDGVTATGGTSTAYTLADPRTLTAYYEGLSHMVKWSVASGDAPTMDVDGLGAKALVWPDGTAVTTNELALDAFSWIMYDLTNTQYMVLSLSNKPALPVAANVFTATQTIQSTDAGATAGPKLIFDRDSASPAAADILGSLEALGKDSADNAETYATMQAEIVDPTTTAEGGQWNFQTLLAGVLADAAHIAAGLWMDGATGGDKGADSINAASYYENGVRVARAWTKTGSTTLTGTSTSLLSGLPTDVEEIEIYIDTWSSNENSQPPMIQIGDSEGIENTSYSGAGINVTTIMAKTDNSSGFLLNNSTDQASTDFWTGTVKLSHMGSNKWTCKGMGYQVDGTCDAHGEKTLSLQLDRVEVTTPTGTATLTGTAFARWR